MNGISQLTLTVIPNFVLVADPNISTVLITQLPSVAHDYREQHNLTEKYPKKAAELKAKMSAYLDYIDAEEIQDVYQARLAELDHFESIAKQAHKNRIAKTGADRALRAEADARLAADLAQFKRNKAQCRDNMRGTIF